MLPSSFAGVKLSIGLNRVPLIFSLLLGPYSVSLGDSVSNLLQYCSFRVGISSLFLFYLFFFLSIYSSIDIDNIKNEFRPVNDRFGKFNVFGNFIHTSLYDKLLAGLLFMVLLLLLLQGNFYLCLILRLNV